MGRNQLLTDAYVSFGNMRIYFNIKLKEDLHALEVDFACFPKAEEALEDARHLVACSILFLCRLTDFNQNLMRFREAEITFG